MVHTDKITIKLAAERLGISYDNARAISSTFNRFKRVKKVTYEERTVTRRSNEVRSKLQRQKQLIAYKKHKLASRPEPTHNELPQKQALKVSIELQDKSTNEASNPTYKITSDEADLGCTLSEGLPQTGDFKPDCC